MTKLTDKQKKQIIADYVDCQNYSEVARKHKRSVPTIKNVVLADDDTLNKLKQKKEENSKDILQYMEEKSQDIQRVLNSLLKGIEIKSIDLTDKDSIRDLSTAYGIILDKQFRYLELQRGMGNNEQLNKVEQLLSKLEEEAKR